MPIATLAVTEVPGYASPVPYVLARMQKFMVLIYYYYVAPHIDIIIVIISVV
jgi:hypothetical protein